MCLCLSSSPREGLLLEEEARSGISCVKVVRQFTDSIAFRE